MAFGLSGDDARSRMVGGDVTVAWVDKDTFKGHAYDYYLDAKSQCSGGRGSCPDENIEEKANSVRLLNAALVNGYSIVTFQRSLRAQDELDRPVLTNVSQPVIWAVGPLNARREVSYHSLANRADVFLDFGRPPKWNCPTPEKQEEPAEPEEAPQQQVTTVRQQLQTSTRRESSKPKPKPIPTPAPASKKNAWHIPPIQCDDLEDGVLYAQMGPTGGKQGYPAITGHVGWGIAWYINGLLIPEINVVRGQTYTFITEGGQDSSVPARYHPFYITDDPIGGYEHKTPEERANIQIFAGAVQNKKGEVRPTGTGRLCNWTPDQSQPPADEFTSFGAYQRTLTLECDPGDPGVIQWTVADDTPDTVYYQCFSHRYLGWKINVLDKCDRQEGSEPIPSVVKAPEDVIDKISTGDMEDSEGQTSVQHATRIKAQPTKLQTVNKTVEVAQQGVNEVVKYEPQYTFVPEFSFYNQETGEPINPQSIPPSKFQEEYSKFENQFIFQDPYFQQHVAQQLLPVAQLQPVVALPAKPQPQPQVIPAKIPEFQNNEQFIKFFHPQQQPQPQHQSAIIYGLKEHHQESAPKHNYHLVPKKPDLDILSSVQNIHYNKKGVTQRPLRIDPTTAAVEFDEKFNEEFLQNYQIMKAQAEENLKKHKHKLSLHSKPSNRLPNGEPIHSTRLQYNMQALRRPVPHHALTLQQRPLPPGMFRPPFLPPPAKQQNSRPGQVSQASHKVHSYAHPNNIPHRPSNVIRPKPARPSLQKLQQMKVQQYLNLQKQLALLTTPRTAPVKDTSALLTSSPVLVDRTTEHAPPAVNTGFNPESVKVEGGFKPILSSGIAPTFKIIDRMDEELEDDKTEDNIGVIDLTKEALFEDTKDALIKIDKNETEGVENVTTEERDLFANQEPQMFEPMFVPSPPDHRIKPEQKHKKKPLTNKSEVSLKHRNQQLQHYNTQKNNYYIKIRPRPNMIRRPLYPNNVVPPFKIPVRGGAPKYRYQESEDSVEETTDFDIIKMNNDTVNVDDEQAENILEVIEMEEGESTTESLEVELEESEKNETMDEVAMANERKDYYLPPKAGVVSYDGKVVSALPPPSLPEKKSKFDFSKLPQSVPFRGEAPPLTQRFNTDALPQLKNTKTARVDILPPSDFPDPPSIRSTQLSLVRDRLEPQGSELDEVVEVINESTAGKVAREGKALSRTKRSPDHVPGHEGPHDHDHDHDHDHHQQMSGNSAQHLLAPTTVLLTVLALSRLL